MDSTQSNTKNKEDHLHVVVIREGASITRLGGDPKFASVPCVLRRIHQQQKIPAQILLLLYCDHHDFASLTVGDTIGSNS
jgi:hypothetical protein